jgi:hypothetical protein
VIQPFRLAEGAAWARAPSEARHGPDAGLLTDSLTVLFPAPRRVYEVWEHRLHGWLNFILRGATAVRYRFCFSAGVELARPAYWHRLVMLDLLSVEALFANLLRRDIIRFACCTATLQQSRWKWWKQWTTQGLSAPDVGPHGLHPSTCAKCTWDSGTLNQWVQEPHPRFVTKQQGSCGRPPVHSVGGRAFVLKKAPFLLQPCRNGTTVIAN